jgi:hypothetical protein
MYNPTGNWAFSLLRLVSVELLVKRLAQPPHSSNNPKHEQPTSERGYKSPYHVHGYKITLSHMTKQELCIVIVFH